MATTILHKANTRGYANHGWLESFHSFSFASYYNPERMNFGALRVLNDDRIDGGTGFGKHPHNNMEIISIPLEGALEHQDSMGNKTIIQTGEIQVMSAGSGVAHSEYNESKTKAGKFLQIWVHPNKQNVPPRYDQLSLNVADRHNTLQQILSPDPADAGVWIHQDAWFHLGRFDADFSIDYQLKRPKNGVYLFVITGEVEVEGTRLEARDALGIWNTDEINLSKTSKDAEILILEVPMLG